MHSVAIKEVFEFVRNGLSIKQSDTASGFPITRIETIWNSSIDVNRFGYADIEDVEKYKDYLLECGDILMTHINSPKHLGKCAIYEGIPEQLIHGMNLLNLRPNRTISFPKYLQFYLNSDYFKNQVKKISNQSVNQASFSSGNLKKLKIPLPPLPEQQKIASILDAADNLRQKDQQLIEKYTALSQSLFLEMFGDPVSNPMGWPMGTSIQYCKFIVPGRDKPKSFSGDIPWVTTNDLNRLTYTGKSKKDIGLTQEEVAEVRAKIIPENSVILTCVGDLGVISINSSPVVINQQLHAFQCDYINISPIFMMYVLSYQTPYMYKMSSSTTVPYMNKTVCNNIPMIYPPITLQNQFAERIQSIEAQKQLAITSLEKSEALFNSLLQRAFKGELTT